ncbi:MAG: nicotinate-nicotinamide nucleotide adenylyltransferase [Bdellovibrionia bacterium]
MAKFDPAIQKNLTYFFLILSLCFQGSYGFAQERDPSFLLDKLYKSSAVEIALSDLNFEMPFIREKVPHVVINSDAETRFQALANFPIAAIVAAPGHRILRNPAQLKSLVEYIERNHGGDFSRDKILINLIVDKAEKKEAQILSVDVWNAHHRLVAYMKAGYTRIGELNLSNMVILINGRTASNLPWDHYIPAAGLDLEKSPVSYVKVKPSKEIRPATIAVAGTFSNFVLGSRNTVGQLYRNTFDWKFPKIGIYFGTFDPVHEGHIDLIKYALNHYGFDEIIIVPNINSINKSNASPSEKRLEMLKIRVKDEPRINLYTGDSSLLIDQFSSRCCFMERMSQTFGTSNIYQLIGQDSYERLLKEEKISADQKHKYLVFRRDEADLPIVVPASISDIVTIADRSTLGSCSSTKIRKQICSGIDVSSKEIAPSVLSYIQNQGMYSSPSNDI